ncbi:hypothetical protein ACQP2P_01450 [Dactylosporangium sp. CA-139114]|uniref:hypothetical protein n=1 Tax=Dactylosporangium sp. CA-139114 TaxID=3239931 RepID=UPI003D96881D
MHEAQPGPALELSHDLAYTVLVQQVADSPTQVILARHEGHRVTVTRLSIVEAAILQNLLSEALQLPGTVRTVA